jgi:hypothetical protein
VIKRRHGLRRCRYHGADGTARWVGLGVIANNLVSTATFLNTRAAVERTRRNETIGQKSAADGQKNGSRTVISSPESSA